MSDSIPELGASHQERRTGADGRINYRVEVEGKRDQVYPMVRPHFS